MQKVRLWPFVVFLWVFWLTGGAGLASGQVEAHVTVKDTSLSTGDTYQQVTVLLQNDVPVRGIELFLTLGDPARTDVTTDYIEVWIDTLNNDTTVFRNCVLGTSGTLTQDFEWIEARGEVGDTAFLDCDWVKVAGMAEDGNPIPPGTGVLFKLYIDVLCEPDTSEDRIVPIFVNGKLSDPDGYLIDSVTFNNGLVFLDYTFCGNLTDCICGDVDASGTIGVVDVVYIINWLFNDGKDMCPEMMGDVNPYRGVGIADIVYLINYLFNDGADPVCVRKY